MSLDTLGSAAYDSGFRSFVAEKVKLNLSPEEILKLPLGNLFDYLSGYKIFLRDNPCDKGKTIDVPAFVRDSLAFGGDSVEGN